MLVGGEVYVKPVPRTGPDGKTVFRPQAHPAEQGGHPGPGTAMVISRASATAEETASGGKYYTLLEKRTVDAAGYLTIENKLFESSDRHSLGIRVSLTRLAQYEALPDRYTYPRPVGGWGSRCCACRW